MTFWLDEQAIKSWYESATPASRGQPQRYSDLAITIVLVIKRVFRLTLRAAQGFIDSIFSLMGIPLRCPDYTGVSRRARSVSFSYPPTRGQIAHLVIDSTGLKVFGEGEWKVKKHSKECLFIWPLSAKCMKSSVQTCYGKTSRTQKRCRVLYGRLTEKSGQPQQKRLTTPGFVTMKCGVRKSARLSCLEKKRGTGTNRHY